MKRGSPGGGSCGLSVLRPASVVSTLLFLFITSDFENGTFCVYERNRMMVMMKTCTLLLGSGCGSGAWI